MMGLSVGLLPVMVAMTTPGLVLCFPHPVETDSMGYFMASPDLYRHPRVRSFMAFAAERIRQDTSSWLRNKDTTQSSA
jgi:DNA-binding transcriptional LysR family regulator